MKNTSLNLSNELTEADKQLFNIIKEVFLDLEIKYFGSMKITDSLTNNGGREQLDSAVGFNCRI